MPEKNKEYFSSMKMFIITKNNYFRPIKTT